MGNYNSHMHYDSLKQCLFSIVFAATCLLALGCSDNRSQSNPSIAASDRPKPSASPTPQKWNSADAIAAFKRANLEVGSPHPIKKSTDPNSLEVEGTEFYLISAGKNGYARVFSYANVDDTRHMKDLYDRFGELVEDKMKSSVYWNYAQDNLLVQISKGIPQKKAQQYFDALQTNR